MTVQGKLVNHHAIIDFLSVSMNALGPPNMHSIFLVAWNSFSCASWSCCVWETCPNEADGTCPVGQTVASRWRGCGALWPPRGISDWHPWSIRSSDSTPSSPGRASSSKLENSMEKDHPRTYICNQREKKRTIRIWRGISDWLESLDFIKDQISLTHILGTILTRAAEKLQNEMSWYTMLWFSACQEACRISMACWHDSFSRCCCKVLQSCNFWMYEILSWLPLTSEFHGAKMMSKIYKKFSYIMNMQRFPCLHSQLLTAWILIIANNGFLTGCTLECLTMLSKSSPETASKKNFWARHKHFSTAWREGVENQIRFSSAPNTPPNRAEKRYKLQDVRI